MSDIRWRAVKGTARRTYSSGAGVVVYNDSFASWRAWRAIPPGRETGIGFPTLKDAKWHLESIHAEKLKELAR